MLALFTEQRWEEMRSRFDSRMAQAAPADLLRTVWQKADRERGAFQTMGTPSVRAVAGYTVVDVPMAYERGELLRRVAFDADGQVAGFFVLPAETERSPLGCDAASPASRSSSESSVSRRRRSPRHSPSPSRRAPSW
ncbi:DUF3887 domain-containing protein [Streptomyces spiralis]|uniref:DUF3887 domain-containing protein n=1 Tax=Streptomyces spiralis TaxID=66376 RepID=UPI001679F868|nr:DUF3887 domain-containing protein [Streptomyces spiralis]